MILRVKNDGTTAMTSYAKQQRAIVEVRKLLGLLMTHGDQKWKDASKILDAGLAEMEKEFCDAKLFPKDESCQTKPGTAESAAPSVSPSRSAS